MWSKQHLRILSQSRKSFLDTPLLTLHRKITASLIRAAATTVRKIESVNMNGTPLILKNRPPVRIIHQANGKADTLPESSARKYQAAVSQLNQLQSNALTLATHQGREEQRFLDTWKYLDRIGLSGKDLEQLPVIHVAGTKGKGSVCSFVDSILREHGLKTGFFSSPHLVSVTERIRLNGTPITEDYFASTFWTLFNRLNAVKEGPSDLPPYFKFLTLMAFHVFLAEKVDVAIIEVGIGGVHDCTNIIRNTKTVGITSLGLDHVDVLGDTIEKIAWQKSGIIKRHSNVFTVKQPGEADDVIKRIAGQNEANLQIVPDFEEYSWSRSPNFNLTYTSVHKLNISLAIQLSFDWLIHLGRLAKNHNRLHCNEKIISGIEKFHWPGRYQIIDRGDKRFYLDGAHTLESIKACLEWFENTSRPKERAKKSLIFYVTGTRDVESLAKPLVDPGFFDSIIICPNIVDSRATIVDNVCANSNSNDLQNRCQEIRKTFVNLGNELVSVNVASSVCDALRSLEESQEDILITGSLYLVGTALIALSACKSP